MTALTDQWPSAPEPLIPTIDLLAAAYHEISHAIIYWSYGWPFESVEIGGPDSGHQGVLVPVPGWRNHRQYAVACIAGAVGESRYSGAAWDELTVTSRSDFRMAREALAAIPDAPSIYEVASEAGIILQTHWRSVERVAFELAARQHLTHTDFLRLLAKW